MRIFSLLGFIALSLGFKYDQKSDPWRFEIEFENEPTALKFENIDGWFLEDGIKYSLSEGNLQIDRKKLYDFFMGQSDFSYSIVKLNLIIYLLMEDIFSNQAQIV